jgi:cell division septum initiation protein DivIVA
VTESSRPAVPSFPRARSGYARSSVDAFVAQLHDQLAALRRDRDRSADEISRLSRSLNEAEARCARLESATLDERGQDILDAASRQAAARLAEAERAADEIVAAAERRAAVVDERARQEHAWTRRKLAQERAELEQQKAAVRSQLNSFRELAVDTAAGLPELRDRRDAESSASVSQLEPAPQHS